jgi:hypothetical protein
MVPELMAKYEAAEIVSVCIWTATAGPTQGGRGLGAKAVGWDIAAKGIAPIA